MVGIGTEMPNNRLSFGNSSLSNRYVTNVNEANIAFNELSSGGSGSWTELPNGSSTTYNDLGNP